MALVRFDDGAIGGLCCHGNAIGICSEVINLFKGPIVLISSDVILWKCKEGSKIIVMMMMMIKCYA